MWNPPQPGYGAGAYGMQPPGAPQYPGMQPPGMQPPGMQPPGMQPLGMHPPPGPGQVPMDPQIQQWFAAVDHDRSGRITAVELQQALVNNNWSHFNNETCRLMIGMFDKDFSGTIDLYEFQALWQYIQQWKQTFEQYDRDRTGTIDQNELLSAFQTMGFRLSPQFAQLVVVKFDYHGRRVLTLDHFIQACVMLKSLTDAFKMRDTGMTGTARISYEDFMSMAVMNKP